MEHFVVSRELAEKLKTAGYPQETQHLWQQKISRNGQFYWTVVRDVEMDGAYEDMAAPLSDELLELMPMQLNDTIIKDNNPDDYILNIWRGTKWNCDYEPQNAYEDEYGRDKWQEKHQESSEKLADALAELWLWCKENGYIK